MPIRLDPAEVIPVEVPGPDGVWTLKVKCLTGREFASLCRRFDAIDTMPDGASAASEVFEMLSACCEGMSPDDVADKLTWRQCQQLVGEVIKANQPGADDLGKSESPPA